MDFLRNKYARILTLVLIAQAALFYGLSRRESVPLTRPLSQFPATLGDWSLVQEGVVDKEIMDVLRADDVLTRFYVEPSSRRGASLFVAYFRSQRTGQAPHSPKNCLPGSGWTPSESAVITIPVPGEPQPIKVNRYVVSKGDEKSVVLYWYQTNRRVIASEYSAKIYSVVDAIRYNRTDTALVRVTVPANESPDVATDAAIHFIQAFFEPLRHFLPS
jgi:EpsI family protein